MNFRQLVDAACRKGIPNHLPPRTMLDIAQACDVSVPTLYNLFNGVKVPHDWTVAKIALGLRLDEAVVLRAIERSATDAVAS